jgi:hypothetical protein
VDGERKFAVSHRGNALRDLFRYLVASGGRPGSQVPSVGQP